MATIENRFKAAVNVIKGLPKNGPYQPSTAMMLKFYGLFKQATEGPCQHKKPAFWDIIGKAKWDAWNDNRQLTKQQAMAKYVEGLQEIIETMSFTENVQNFVGSLSGLDNISLDELEMLSPGLRELAESHPNSPFNSRTNSPQHGTSTNSTASTPTNTKITTTLEEVVQPKSTESHDANHNVTLANGHDDKNDDIIINNVNSTPPPTPAPQVEFVATSSTSNYIDPSDDEYDDPFDLQHDITVALSRNTDLLHQIEATVARMNADISAVNTRMGKMELTLQELRITTLAQQNKPKTLSKPLRQYPKWWPFANISPGWFALLVLWPFLIKRFANMLNKTRNR